MTGHENHNAPVTKRRSFRSRAPSVSTREQEVAPRFWAPNMDSNFFRPLFDALNHISVNHPADRAESPRESESETEFAS